MICYMLLLARCYSHIWGGWKCAIVGGMAGVSFRHELLKTGRIWKVAAGSANILYYTILYYTILYYIILYYTILYYTILYYTILYYTAILAILYYTILYYTILHYTTLYYTILYCYTIYTILYYTTLYYNAILYFHYAITYSDFRLAARHLPAVLLPDRLR